MIGEIIGAIAGKNISKHVDGVGGAGAPCSVLVPLPRSNASVRLL